MKCNKKVGNPLMLGAKKWRHRQRRQEMEEEGLLRVFAECEGIYPVFPILEKKII